MAATMSAGLWVAACSSASSQSTTSGSVASTGGAITVETTNGGVTTTSSAAVTTSTVATTASTAATAAPTATTVADRPAHAGAQRLHFEVGPIEIKPGQNNIAFRQGIPKPDIDGFVVRIAPNLRLADGVVPAVDDIHLHHGVWLNRDAADTSRPGLPERFFAAGEEKTIIALPDGYGYPVKTTDRWVLNYMIHNLWNRTKEVWVTYDLDVVPASAPEAATIVPAHPVWTDVENGSGYPVFDVHRGEGSGGTFTFPDQRADAYGGKTPLNTWTLDRDGVLLTTAGHLHPGGLRTDLWVERAGATAPGGHAKDGAPDTAHLFTSEAHYYEPAGAVSWDVAMTATNDDWRVAVKAGDVLSTDATYDSTRASWYESMGIMVVWMADHVAAGDGAVAADPFTTAVDGPGQLTHGHLPENDHHGGAADGKYFDLTALAPGPLAPSIQISGFEYAAGDMQFAKNLPTVAPGQAITFENLDAPLANGEWHTITACKAPCNGETGVAYPLADGAVEFDSGQLGDAGPPTAGRVTWSTPTDLAPGTYTYFCRIHPFMRGGFAVVPS
jgi:plastocyanin